MAAAQGKSDKAKASRSKRGARRTPEQIDAIVTARLAQADCPIGAYDIAQRAAAAGDFVHPNQVYRTLDRLVEQGRICRVESLSAYILRPSGSDICQICEGCGSVRMASNPQIVARLANLARDHGFTVRKTVIEIHGHCCGCGARNKES